MQIANLKMGLAALLLWWTLTVSVAAAQPDPARFGVAVEQGDLPTVSKWLEAGLDPDFIADRIGSGLMIAAWEGNIDMLELFAKHGARIDLSNRYDEQALQLAAWNGHLEALKWLLAHGASANRSGPHWSALHYAAFADRDEAVRLLIQNGGDVNARSPNGSTALMMTAREGHEQLAALLLEAGADPTLTNESGDSALTWAMRHEHFRIAGRVSTEAEFSRAAKVAPVSHGTPVKSQPAPPEIEQLLRQMRLAEATGRPIDDLRKKFFAAVARFKQGGKIVSIDKRSAGKAVKRGKPQALVITAQRGRSAKAGRERVELVYAAKEAPSGDGTQLRMTSKTAQGGGTAAEPSVPEILDRISRARAAGKPVEDLRQALFQAIGRFKSGAESPGR